MINIGMSERDIREYSFLKIISSRANGRPLDGVEEQASNEVAKRSRKAPQGTFIPADVLEHRTLTKGDPTAGGDLVATNLLASSFIEILVASMQVKKLGAITLGGLVGDVQIPKQTGRNDAVWVTEGNGATPSDQVFGQVGLIPKTVTIATAYSRKLILQSSLDIEKFVRMDLARSIALAIDGACVRGSEVGEPLGIIGYPEVGSVVMGDPNGAVPTYAKLIEFVSKVAANNALIGNNLGFLTSSNCATKLMLTPKIADSVFPVFCWEGSPAQIQSGEGTVAGFRALISNQVPSTITKGGSGATLSAMIFGAWDQLVIGEFGNLDVLIDPYTYGNTGAVVVRMFQDVDIALRHAACFAVSTDIVTT